MRHSIYTVRVGVHNVNLDYIYTIGDEVCFSANGLNQSWYIIVDTLEGDIRHYDIKHHSISNPIKNLSKEHSKLDVFASAMAMGLKSKEGKNL